MEFDIKNVFKCFAVEGVPYETVPIKSGHINQTFLIRSDTGDAYILQRINHTVFRNPEAVIGNKIRVAAHIAEKRKGLPDDKLDRRILRFFETRSGGHIQRDQDGNYWNLLNYIEDSRVYLKTPNAKVAHEAGKALGGFLRDTEDIDPTTLVETIPRFHSMSFRYSQFDEALENASEERVEMASGLIETAHDVRDEMQSLERRVAEGVIPVRTTHNDTKISNVLFSEDDKALCVIDLDTVMPGVVHYDFGDAVRTICNQGEEDEQDLSKVGFDLEYFEAFARGFLSDSGLHLSESESEGLAFSSRVMTFIVGLRMLTDFLNNDIYFDTQYDTHNLVRARSQFRLAELIDENLERMEKIVAKA
ncbi:MAG: aminoglycoside phosphotransferase family protein [Acidobacteria bacterium]|nr:MAG: aminoglycoside phosphotransferase family protein [Acidobacteriota bacterium]REJ98192.1 MAG: aminoglycoside phosphotransferase family protein [Acidobacteriota bacterium]REK16936.1 MAG: aminoglycoside phosphotransferase family protein [Acidobacteriota bacterium]REK42846.1 MAG: aminoglycoside phosphotransferase family protein [Acidobacteriota bacterium]